VTLTCAILPPSFELALRDGTACDLPRGHGEEHQTVTPDGKRWRWNGFDCAYPEDCRWSDSDDGECCVTFGEVAA
jgi:hypothetical protein